MRLASMLGVLLIFGCGGSVGSTGGTDSSPDGGAQADASDTSIADVPSGFDTPFHDTGKVVDGGGGCTPPDTVPGYGLATCCNGLPCAGECVETSPGKTECRCLDVSGGCSEPYVCCYVGGGGCQTRLTCDRSH